MPTLQELTEQMKQHGNIDPAASNKKSQWDKMLAMLAMAQKSNPQTMAGFAIGNLLRQGFDSWKERYDARGEWKNALRNMPENKREQWLGELKANNPKRYEYLSNKYGDLINQTPQTTATPTVNNEAVSQAVRNYLSQNVPMPNLLGDGGKLAQATSWEQLPLALGNPFEEELRRRL